VAYVLVFTGNLVGAGATTSLQLLLVVGKLEALFLQVTDALLQVLVFSSDYVGSVACRSLCWLLAGATRVRAQASLMSAWAALQLDLLS
jgi:hypothetical protein